jgi:hypothetical protein
MWEFLVLPEYDDAFPLPLCREFVDLETDKGILSHPLDLLPQCGEAIEALVVQVEMKRNDVGLVIPGARQTSDMPPGEHRAALFFRHLVDYHRTPHSTRSGGLRPKLAALTLVTSGHLDTVGAVRAMARPEHIVDA